MRSEKSVLEDRAKALVVSVESRLEVCLREHLYDSLRDTQPQKCLLIDSLMFLNFSTNKVQSFHVSQRAATLDLVFISIFTSKTINKFQKPAYLGDLPTKPIRGVNC